MRLQIVPDHTPGLGKFRVSKITREKGRETDRGHSSALSQWPSVFPNPHLQATGAAQQQYDARTAHPHRHPSLLPRWNSSQWHLWDLASPLEPDFAVRKQLLRHISSPLANPSLAQASSRAASLAPWYDSWG